MVTLAVRLVGRSRRRLPVVIPLRALMTVALVLANYDIAGGAVLGVAVAGAVVDRMRPCADAE